MHHCKIKLQVECVLPWSSQWKNEKNSFYSASVSICAAFTIIFLGGVVGGGLP